MQNTAVRKLETRIKQLNSLVCVGLDCDVGKLPAEFHAQPEPQFAFNKMIIDATHEFVCAYKPNLAFYEAQGEQGMVELKKTLEYLQSNYPDILTICDAKRADIGNTNQGYVTEIFDQLKFDAVTLHPYLGKEALAPFLEREDKLNIILCRTSNPGAPELQDLEIMDGAGEQTKKLWQVVAEKVSRDWNEKGNCAIVVGATYPEEMNVLRQLDDTLWWLVPGVGAQGGDVGEVMKNGANSQKSGLIINAGRSIIFAKDPAAAARELRDEINRYR